ncbi:replication initiator protein A [Nitrosospira multiformis]|uniref:Replication initiator protein A n=1 Tax=Nitrosospira multiformis TaxID=1231 RepID=A0A1I7IT82_9PROT|nr:replication initiator protein A [Nitrosospira multiformis]SFU76153.1 Replication initiator protein A [Nitrosospira multiformis]
MAPRQKLGSEKFKSTVDLFDNLEAVDQVQVKLKAEKLIRHSQEWHRELSEQIVEANRTLARLANNKIHSNDKEITSLRTRISALQAKRSKIEADLNAESEWLKAYLKQANKSEHQARPHLPYDSHQEREKKLLPVRHKNRDFFLADMFDYALKDDGASMEVPIFTLATKTDLSIWKWVSKDKNKSIEIYPSVKGRATQFDKDVLIYVVSQITEALNRGRDDAKNRTVRFTVYDYLVTTNRGVGGDDYKRLQEAFERLAGTRITTDIRTGGERVKEGFGIIESWRTVEKSREDERMIAVEVTLSRWLFNAVQAFEVLTIHSDYFRLRKPLERRLYELARKHCGHQSQWSIGLELLREKSGSRSTLYEFRRMVKSITQTSTLPEYRMALSDDDKVTFYTRDNSRSLRDIANR